MPSSPTYVSVLLPLALPQAYTYRVAKDLVGQIAFGCRVEVPLRGKLYSGLVVDVDADPPQSTTYKIQFILSVIDEQPIIHEQQYRLWQWMAHYYCCTLGEVMGVALPSGLKLASETQIVLSPLAPDDFSELGDQEYLIAEALTIQKSLPIGTIRDIVGRKTIYPYLRKLMDLRIIDVKESLQPKYKPKMVAFLELAPAYAAQIDDLTPALDLLARSEHQTKALLAFAQLSRQGQPVARTAVTDLAAVSPAVIKAIEKKGIWSIVQRPVSRIAPSDGPTADAAPMSDLQRQAYEQISATHKQNKPALLHGVTGSGKTRVYIELIKECVAAGRQVLFMLPEIGLTTQIVQRIKAVFGDKVGVYHSRLNNHVRVEMWQQILDEHPIVLGARSALFLPFVNLGLIIVDEEHDSSYKQQDPAPRYNARDAAVWLAHHTGARIVLGSATPSLESMHNVETGKYDRIAMMERFGEAVLPKISIIDLRRKYKSNAMKKMLSLDLYRAISAGLEQGEQALLFQNRRGYSPVMQCTTCAWTAQCPNCDLSLTLHKYFDELKCHYCGHRQHRPKACPQCGSLDLKQLGYGTEKIQEEVQELFPQAVVKRMDFDTVKTKNALEGLIYDFEQRKIDILVGTQMITKGLDFDNVSVVGVLNADTMLRFPDFRASERAFQMLTQVAGRAGRSAKRGHVMIQTFEPNHVVLHETVSYAVDDFVAREAAERKTWLYPPYFRLIHIQLKHRNADTVQAAAHHMAEILRHKLGKRILGPAAPGVARLRGLFLQNIMIKSERDQEVVNYIKSLLVEARQHIKEVSGFQSVRVNIDVDPY